MRDDASVRETAESVKEGGVPVLARPREEGGYEWIAGRRKHAWELAGLTAMPAIARSIARDAAAVIMADGSLQRESILPSQRARACRMKPEAIVSAPRRPLGRALGWPFDTKT